MDFDLNEDQRAFQQTARDFARHEMAQQAAHWDSQAIFPREVISHAGQLGFCGLYVPEALGGLGLSRLDACIIFEELAAACPSTTAYLTIHNMATAMLAQYADKGLARDWVPALAAGDKLASYCLTEPGSGSDAASLRTRAEKQGDYYLLSGDKAFISGAGATDMLVVMARTGGAGADGISAFAVPADSAGIRFGRKEEKMGWNSQPTRAIHFDQVKVHASHLLDIEGTGFKLAMRGLDGGRINIASCSVGAAQAALSSAHSYMQQRQQFKRKLADFQALQFKLADMQTELIAARQMVRLAATRLDQRDPQASVYCAMAKRLATDTGFSVCNEALQIHGGYGYIREYPLERYLRDVRVHQILEGTNEIMRVIVARHLLNHSDLESCL